MHRSLLTNFLFRHFHALLGPFFKRLAAQMLHFLDKPLFRRVSLAKRAAGVFHRQCDRRQPVAKVGMLA
jgi:hypothetical protein